MSDATDSTDQPKHDGAARSSCTVLPRAVPPRNVWQLTLAAVRANLLPGAILWVVGLTIVISYYHWPEFANQLQRVGQFKQQWGLVYSIPSLAIFGGLIPFLLQSLQRDQQKNFAWSYLLFLLIFWAIKGAEVDLLYRAQVAMFGDNAHPWTLLKKVLIDQGIYVPLWAVPSMAIGYLWANRGFRLQVVRDAFKGRWYRRLVVPILIPNMLVWVPAVTMIYMMPEPLQVPVQNLVACLFACMMLFLSRHEEELHNPELHEPELHDEPRSSYPTQPTVDHEASAAAAAVHRVAAQCPSASPDAASPPEATSPAIPRSSLKGST